MDIEELSDREIHDLAAIMYAEKDQYKGYLFKGRNGNISHRTVQQIVKKAAKKAGIKKNVHPHVLRHSFSTHLIEAGYGVTTVQSLLGHSSTETTMVYVHTAASQIISIKSPLDM